MTENTIPENEKETRYFFEFKKFIINNLQVAKNRFFGLFGCLLMYNYAYFRRLKNGVFSSRRAGGGESFKFLRIKF